MVFQPMFSTLIFLKLVINHHFANPTDLLIFMSGLFHLKGLTPLKNSTGGWSEDFYDSVGGGLKKFVILQVGGILVLFVTGNLQKKCEFCGWVVLRELCYCRGVPRKNWNSRGGWSKKLR